MNTDNSNNPIFIIIMSYPQRDHLHHFVVTCMMPCITKNNKKQQKIGSLKMKTPLFITSFLLIGGVMLANAQSSDNPYYSNDIDAAVKEAENSPSNETYVGNRWYNRTTSKSVDFPKLMNTEMSSEIVDGALDATAAGPGDVAPVRTSPLELNAEDVIANKQDDSELDFLADTKSNRFDISIQPSTETSELSPTVYKVDKVEYRTESFSGSATNIRSEASSRAYITPEP